MAGSGARFDDLTTGAALRFDPPDTVLAAHTPADVVPVLDAVDAVTRRGAWAFGMVAYEAGHALLDLAPPLHRTTVPLVWFGITGAPTAVPVVGAGGATGPTVWRGAWTAAQHAARVARIRAAIAAGEVYQVNLTDRLHAGLDDDDRALLRRYGTLAHGQGGAHHAFVDTGRHVLLSASPELFLEQAGPRVTMRPMKGTAGRGRDLAEDAAIVRALRTSEKDRAENVMIVDLVRNDLARIAMTGSVRVERLCEVERYATVHQLTSQVSAQLRPETGLVDLFRATFPAGSVTGAPKQRAMQLVDEVEDAPRGAYCGAIGFVGPPDASPRLRFNVAIRTVVVDRHTHTATYGTGGGITWGSDAAAEFAELTAKTALLHRAPEPFALLETMRRGPDGVVHRLAGHLDRLQKSATYWGFRHDGQAVRRAIAAAVDAPGGGPGAPARLRLTLERDGHCRVAVLELPPPAQGPVRLALDDDPVDSASPWLRHKTTRRAVYDVRRARHPDADDVVLVNERGEVTEAATANLAALVDGRWLTPALDCGCLPGVERAARLAAGSLTEAVLHPADLDRAERIEVLNALRGTRPAVLLPRG